MKTSRFFLIVTLFFLLKTFLACTTTPSVPKEGPVEAKPLFLIHSENAELIDFVDIFLKEISLLGCEVRDLSSQTAQDGDKKDKGFYGSGFFISESGLFLTAYHVIEQAETIILRKIDGKLFLAKVLIQDPTNDIAVLSTIGGEKENHWLSLGNPPGANIGDAIRVLGYPVPNLIGIKPKLASGFISSDAGIGGDPTRFAFSAPLEVGYSGAAILNIHNEVIGIASEQTNDEWFLLGRTGSLPPDINYGVKINYAKILLESVLGEEISRNDSNMITLEDAIDSTALVLINTQNVPLDPQPMQQAKIVLVEFSKAYLCNIIHYTIFEFNKSGTDQVMGEVLASGYVGGTPVSNPKEMVDTFIKEMRIKSTL